MGRPPSCNCHCGCCLPPYVYGSAPDPASIPQRWQIDTGSWAWGLPSGLTEDTISGPLTPAVETQIESQEWKALLIARALENVGQSNVAWSFWWEKYDASFGMMPAQTPYGSVSQYGPYKWLAVDDQAVVQFFHSAYGVVRGSIGYELSSVPAVCESSIIDMVDDSDNGSNATPWRVYDQGAIDAIDAEYPQCFVDDLRIGNDGYSVPWSVGQECNSDAYWKSLAVTFGNTLTVDVYNQIPGPCYWRVVVRLRPRWSVWSNGMLTRPEYYRTGSAPVPPTLHANGYIRNYAVSFGQQTRYTGRFGYVHPAAMLGSNYGDWQFTGRGWAVPPYLIEAGYGTSYEGALGFDDTLKLRNRGGPGDLGTLSTLPPGGWRSWIELTYLSDNPIDCTADITDAEAVPLHLVTDPVPIVGAPFVIPWADYLTMLSDSYGLSSIPSTMTLQRLADLTA